MTADGYLQFILFREAVDTGPTSPVRGVQLFIEPILREWGNVFLMDISPSGSFAKGTANHSGTDIDLFVSLSEHTPDTLREIYNSLFNRMLASGYTPRRQNVSINVKVLGYSVDLVPAKRQPGLFDGDHSLYRNKKDSWTKTNVIWHIGHVRASGRLDEIRIIKLWRDQHGLDFPSFYLELSVMRALTGQFSLSQNLWTIFRYLRDTFPSARIIDPANTNNVLSEDLTVAEKAKISAAARRALSARTWDEIVT